MSDLEIQKEVDRSDSSKAINAMSWSLGMKLYHTVIPASWPLFDVSFSQTGELTT